MDFIEHVPKDRIENLRWRIAWRERAIADRGLQDAFRQAAFEDILFWFNAFCWCFEPRKAVKVLPFLTWEHQDPAIITMDQAIDDAEKLEEQIDVVVDKSRGQGATWIYLMIFLRRWLRDELFSAGLVTRNENLVDSARDPDTLMWKIVWQLRKLPRWMLPQGFDFERHRSLTDHSLFNPVMESTIVGYSATGDVARGGRKTVFGFDELAAFKPGEDYQALASTQQVTFCRFLVSTFKGDSGAYYDSARKDTNARKVLLDWKDNPTQNQKLYRVVHGKTFGTEDFTKREKEIIERQHTMLRRRGYQLEGKPRNIWYNNECLRPGATPRLIAQELDRDPRGSVSKVFAAEVLDYAKTACCRPPLLRGRLVYDTETAEVVEPFVVEAEQGELSLWIRPDLRGQIMPGVYSVGADISGGGGGAYTANSVLHVLNKMTGEQVGEWVSNRFEPRKFAGVAVAVCRWFHDALLIPEANFGGAFMNQVIEHYQYPNLYYRESEIEGVKERTKKPGFWMANDDTKLKIFELMQAGIANRTYIPRSEDLIIECGEYEWSKGKIIHIGSRRTDDDGAQGKAHADRVIAAAVGIFEAVDMLGSEHTDDEIPDHAIPEGCMAARLRDLDASKSDGDPWIESGLDIFSGNRLTGIRDTWI
jgi:hypothetical protein